MSNNQTPNVFHGYNMDFVFLWGSFTKGTGIHSMAYAKISTILQQVLKSIFTLYVRLNKICFKEEVKINKERKRPYVTSTLFAWIWYIFVSRSFVYAQIFQYIYIQQNMKEYNREPI